MVRSFFELLKVNSFVRILGVVIIFAYAESSFMFSLLLVDSLTGVTESGTQTYWRFTTVALAFFIIQIVALFIYPYFVGRKFGRYGLFFGTLWSISMMLFLPAFGYVFGKMVDFKLLFGPAGFDMTKELIAGEQGLKLEHFLDFVLPVFSCWLGELSSHWMPDRRPA